MKTLPRSFSFSLEPKRRYLFHLVTIWFHFIYIPFGWIPYRFVFILFLSFLFKLVF